MILSLDSTITLISVVSMSVLFLNTVSNFDFSMREIAAQRLADDTALTLQENPETLELLQDGDATAMEELLNGFDEAYCIEAYAGGNKAGQCAGQHVSRKLIFYSDENIMEAIVSIYFK